MKFSVWRLAKEKEFAEAGISEASNEVMLLCMRIMHKDRSFFHLYDEEEMTCFLTDTDISALERTAKRRAKREPLAYILGEQYFYDSDFLVGAGVLIPRADSEILVDTALASLCITQNDFSCIVPQLRGLSSPIRIMDLCTGSGCVGITIAKQILLAGRTPDVFLTDISSQACYYAKKNVERMECPSCAHVVETNLWPSMERMKYGWQGKRADMIVANPPYVRADEMSSLMPEVSAFEPSIALTDSSDGLSFYRRIVKEYDKYLSPGGVLIVEHGFDQGADVRNLFARNGFISCQTIKDYGGNDRVTIGQRP